MIAAGIRSGLLAILLPFAAGADAAPKRLLRILFTAQEINLPPAAKPQLSQIAPLLTQEKSRRIRLESFAQFGTKSGLDWQARRLALHRAQAVRNCLIDLGIDRRRIDLHIMGPDLDAPPNRVDIVPAGPWTPGAGKVKNGAQSRNDIKSKRMEA